MRARGADRGAAAFMLAISLFLLIGAAAIAVDIAAIWLDRSTDQKVTDSASAAGALEVLVNDGQGGCETALNYVASNTREIDSIDTSGCVTFSGSCSAGSELTLSNVGRYEITVTYPVTDGDPLMTSGIVGGQPQALHAKDGTECERLAVKMTSRRNSLFAQVLGFGEGRTTVHTVARATQGDGQPPINLLVLDRTGCETILVRGNGGIIVDAVIDRDDDGNPIGLAPGLAATDSDGSECSGSGTITLEGSNSDIRADGPECPEPPWTGGTHSVGGYTAYEGCGMIQTFAPGTPGCSSSANLPACRAGAGWSNRPEPEPTALPRRYTREKVDHLFNCHSDYTALPSGTSWATDPLTGNQSIGTCEEGTDPHIYNLISFVREAPHVPDGFERWNEDLGNDCDLDPGTAIDYAGNVVVDCANFEVKRDVTIRGDVVFNGNVSVTSSGHLRVINTVADPGWVFFRSGTLTKGGTASLTFDYSMVYMSKSSNVALAGGSGSLRWIAPVTGSFDILAFWSDSAIQHQWAGQADMEMEGVFFMPRATMVYLGQSGMEQTDAQWIAYRLEAGGNGKLVVSPRMGRAISFEGPRTILVR